MNNPQAPSDGCYQCLNDVQSDTLYWAQACHINTNVPCARCERYGYKCVPVMNTNLIWRPSNQQSPDPPYYTGPSTSQPQSTRRASTSMKQSTLFSSWGVGQTSQPPSVSGRPPATAMHQPPVPRSPPQAPSRINPTPQSIQSQSSPASGPTPTASSRTTPSSQTMPPPLVPVRLRDFSLKFTSKELRETPTLAVDRPFYCHTPCHLTEFKSAVPVQTGDEGKVLAYIRNPKKGDLYCQVGLTRKNLVSIVPIENIYINKTKKWGQWEATLKLPRQASKPLKPIPVPDAANQSKFYKAIRCTIEEFWRRRDDIGLNRFLVTTIDTDDKRKNIADKIHNGAHRAGSGPVLDRDDFTIAELRQASQNAVGHKQAGIYFNNYDNVIRVGKSKHIGQRTKEHIQFGTPGEDVSKTRQKNHYAKAQAATNKCHRAVCILDGDHTSQIAEQVFVNLLGSGANGLTGERARMKTQEAAISQAKVYHHGWVKLCTDAASMLEIAQTVHVSTGWVPLTKRQNSGVDEGLNMSMPLLEFTESKQLVWSCDETVENQLIYHQYPRRLHDKSKNIWAFHVASLHPIGVHKDTDPSITADTVVYPRVLMTKDGSPVMYPWANIPTLSFVSDQAVANSFEISIFYEAPLGTWKHMICQRDDNMYTTRTGPMVPSSYSVAMGFRYYLLDVPVTKNPFGIGISNALVYGVSLDPWNQEVIVSKKELSTNPFVAGQVVDRAVRTNQVKATGALLVPSTPTRKPEDRCDFCVMTDTLTCHQNRKNSGFHGCPRCHDAGILCTRNPVLRRPGSALMQVIARPSKNNTPPAFTVLEKRPEIVSVLTDI